MKVRDNKTMLDSFDSLSMMKQFNEMLKTINKDDMTWTHSAPLRRRICLMIGIGDSTFKNNLKKMQEVDILFKLKRGYYKVNTDYIEYG